MKKLILIACVSLLVLAGCMGNGTKPLTVEQTAKEKARVMEVIKQYNDASNKKSFSSIIETLDENVVFFGSDSTEIIHSLNDFKKMIQNQWNQLDIQSGDMVDTWIQMDPTGTLASVIYGQPSVITLPDGRKQRVFFRIARTLKKQDNQWLIVSGIVSMTASNPDGVKIQAEEAAAAAKK